MRKIVLTLVAAMVLSWQSSSFAASSVDALIQKLEDKGILTNQEAAQLKDQVTGDEQTNEQATFKSLLPDWINGFKLSGDFRFRTQTNYRKVPLTAANTYNFRQTRERIRARLNFEDQINDKFKIVVGIATDGGTPRSNNYTLGGQTTKENGNTTTSFIDTDDFGKPALVLNKAYAVYTPNDMITAMVGKMDNPIWEAAGASFFWDPDITPEGGTIQIQKKINDYITPFAQETVLDLHDLAPSTTVKTDPYMMVTQGGIKGNLTDQVYYKAGVTWYDINNPSHYVDTTLSTGTNTTTTGPAGTTILKYNFDDVIVEGAEIGINDPFGDMLPSPIYIPQAGVFGDFANNYSKGDEQSKAWEMGAYVGNSAINGWGTWKLSSYYKVLERDSWLDVLPDDDFYSGDTDTKGWRSELDLGLAKNVWFVMSYFNANVFKYYGTSTMSKSAPDNTFQMDLNLKF